MRIAKQTLKWLFAFIFIAAGVTHFVIPGTYARIMPPVFPFPLVWVYASGVCEIVLGVLLLVPHYKRTAAWGLIILLVLVFPANVYMALNPQLFSEFSRAALYVRLPVQFVLIAVAYWFTRKEEL